MRVKYCISLLAMLFAASTAMAGVVVIMRREVQTPGRYVRVCDIARVDGPRAQAREVAMIVLGPAPARGEAWEISRWDIESRLFEMGIAANVSFSGNSRVTVRGDGAPDGIREENVALGELLPVPSALHMLGGEPDDMDVRPAPVAKPAPMVFDRDSERPAAIRDLLTKDARARVGKEIGHYFAERYRGGKNSRSDIEVEAKLVSSSAEIPYSAYEIKVKDAEGRVPGKATLRLTVRDTDEASPREVHVVADTTVYGQALVAARNLSRDETLDKSDVAITRVKMESGAGYLPPSPRSAVGRETKRPFRVGEVILAADAPFGFAVKRGDVVVNLTEGRGWDIKTNVKAHGSGAVGDIIMVEEVKSKAKYPARIVGPGTVEVVVKYDSRNMVRKQ